MKNIKSKNLILFITLIFTSIGCNEYTPINLGDVTSLEYIDTYGIREAFIDKNGLYYMYSGLYGKLSIAVIKDIKNKNYRNLPQEITIPKTITTPGGNTYNVEIIDINAFKDCKSIKRIKLSDKTILIGDSAFYKSSIKEIDFGYSVNQISTKSFFSCDSLKTVVIPRSVTYIGENAFSNCKNLESVTINSNQLTIEMPVLLNCPKFTTLNYNVEKILNSGSGPCFPEITTLNIGDNVTTVPNILFRDCAALINLNIGINVSTIGDYTFSSNLSLEEVHCKAFIPPSLGVRAWHYYFFNSLNQAWVTYNKNGLVEKTVLYVPLGRATYYRVEEGWDKFFTVIEE